ncbi:GH16870 [Drosophila grimshawi]|uniref:GH16870 n=1 Tax=Drosophila grimshawi TaxID=7222 RepID=B4IXB3_DROGR|nr:GH16870 [Drosophila grimshawi]
MHCTTLVLIAICCLGTGLSATTSVPVGTIPASNFYLNLKSILRNVPQKQIEHLVQAYLLNDAEFQAVVREINSLTTYRLGLQLLNQPEFRQLLQWTSQQLILAGGSIKVFEELELEIKVLNKHPHWAQSVNGINGFEQEFSYLYPVAAIRKLLESSAQQSPVFGEFWRRVVALKPTYERFLATPQATGLANRLRALGVDVNNWDATLRYQLGWSNETLPNYDYEYNYGFY